MRVAVVTEKPRVVVSFADIVRQHVVVVSGIGVGHNCVDEVHQRLVGVAFESSITADVAKIPFFPADVIGVPERDGTRDGEEISLSRVIVYHEGVALGPGADLVFPPGPHPVVAPRCARKEHLYATVRVDSKDGHIGVELRPKVHPHLLVCF